MNLFCRECRFEDAPFVIYGKSPVVGPTPGTPEFDDMMNGYREFTQDIKSKGVMISGDPLQEIETATTVRVRVGKTDIVDGPFAETKEQLGGYYLLECKDLDEALGYAARIPTATYGSVEVRPIMVFG